MSSILGIVSLLLSIAIKVLTLYVKATELRNKQKK